MSEQEQTPTIQIGDKVYDVNDFNDRGRSLINHIQVVGQRRREQLREVERQEVLLNTLNQTLNSHIQEVGYEPIRTVDENVDDGTNEETEQS